MMQLLQKHLLSLGFFLLIITDITPSGALFVGQELQLPAGFMANYESYDIDISLSCPKHYTNYQQCTCSVFVDRNQCQECSTLCSNKLDDPRQASTSLYIDCETVLRTEKCATVDCNGDCFPGIDYHVKYKINHARMAVFIFCLVLLLMVIGMGLMRHYENFRAARQILAETLHQQDEDDPILRNEIIDACLTTKKLNLSDLLHFSKHSDGALDGDIEQDDDNSDSENVDGISDAIEDSIQTTTDKRSGDDVNTINGISYSNEEVVVQIGDSGDKKEAPSECQIHDNTQHDQSCDNVVVMDSSFDTSMRDSVKQDSLSSSSLPPKLASSSSSSSSSSLASCLVGMEDTCQICLEMYREGQEVSYSHVSKCKHAFHHDCIWKWLQRHSSCPACREELITLEKILQQNSSNNR